MKTKIKREALEKLDGYVKEELKYLKDTNSSLDNFNLKVEDLFNEEELIEVGNIIKQLNGGNIELYCFCRDIIIPKELIKHSK